MTSNINPPSIDGSTSVCNSILAEYAEGFILGYAVLIVAIMTVKMAETKEDELNKELERREAVHRDHKEKDILPSVAVSLVKMRMALAEYDVELAESFAPDEAEVLQLANEKAEEIRDRIINGYEPPDTGISTLNNTLKNHAAMAAKEHVLYRVVVFTRVESLLHFMKLREVVRLIGDLSRNAIRAAGAAANGHGAVRSISVSTSMEITKSASMTTAPIFRRTSWRHWENSATPPRAKTMDLDWRIPSSFSTTTVETLKW